MVLQRLVFPEPYIKETELLYFRLNGNAEYVSGKILMQKGSECLFNTYFGSFTFSKWKKYTTVQNVFLTLNITGKFLVTVTDVAENGKENVLVCEETDGNYKKSIDGNGIVYIKLECISEAGELLGGYFETDEETENSAEEVVLGMVICTYKRETFVNRNLNILKEKITENKESPLFDKFSAIVCDNGHTLNEYDDGKIKIVHNKNAGGAGGFTRGILECKAEVKEKGTTHVLLTDDDISFETEAIERAYSFIRVLKNEYKEAFIGGSMFRLDNRKIQNESANRWENHNVIPLKRYKDMTEWKNVLDNESEEKINYFSWWFCCVPMSVIGENNLPLPVFIKRDDIEYGLRNGKIFITLNGINVWHEPFENKRPAFLEYYYIRNQCIMESVLGSDFSKEKLKKKLFRQLKTDIFTFRYLESEIRFKGVEDFLKGIDFIKSADPEKLNAEIINSSRKVVPLSEAEIEIDYKKYEANKKPKESKLRKIIRKISLNGWLFPSLGRKTYLPSAFPKPSACFAKKYAINYDESTKSVFITEKSIRKAFLCLKKYCNICKRIDNSFDFVKNEYYQRKGEITGTEFWENYLELK